MTFRAFICVDLAVNEAVREFAEALRRSRAPLKLVDLTMLHLTLKFLGDTPESAVEGIVAAMEESVSGEAPFDLRLGGTGVFPGEHRINVVWVGVEDGGRLGRIAARLESGMARRGFPPEDREFQGHVTIGRVKGPQEREVLLAAVKARAAVDFGTRRVVSLHLKKSVLSAQGPSYSDIGVVRLPAGT